MRCFTLTPTVVDPDDVGEADVVEVSENQEPCGGDVNVAEADITEQKSFVRREDDEHRV